MSSKSVRALEFQLAARSSDPSRHGHSIRIQTGRSKTLTSFARASRPSNSIDGSRSQLGIDIKTAFKHDQSQSFSSSSHHRFSTSVSCSYALRPAREVEDTGPGPARSSNSPSPAQQSPSVSQPIRHLRYFPKPGNIFQGELQPIYVYSNLWKRKIVMYAPSTVKNHVQQQMRSRSKSQLAHDIYHLSNQRAVFQAAQRSESTGANLASLRSYLSSATKGSTEPTKSEAEPNRPNKTGFFSFRNIAFMIVLMILADVGFGIGATARKKLKAETKTETETETEKEKHGDPDPWMGKLDDMLGKMSGLRGTVNNDRNEATKSVDQDVDVAALGLKEIGVDTK